MVVSSIKYHIQTLKTLKTYYGKFYQSNKFENELFLNKRFVLLLMGISSKKYHIQTLKTLKLYYGKFLQSNEFENELLETMNLYHYLWS